MMDKMIVPFKHWHYEWMANNAAEGPVALHMQGDVIKALECDASWTAVVNGQPIAAGGTLQQWPGRHVAWTYMHTSTGPHMPWLTKEVRRALDRLQGRIEFTVRKDFEKGHRWAKILGFTVESPLLTRYGPFGEDHIGYVRFN